MNHDDKRWTELALNNIDADIVRPVDANAAAHELARCSVAIVSRLHAGILASLSDTPVISLEYQPKCRDFALSINDERSLIRTDQLDSRPCTQHPHGLIEYQKLRHTPPSQDYGNTSRTSTPLWHVNWVSTAHDLVRGYVQPSVKGGVRGAR
jgi:hypothetical protein